MKRIFTAFLCLFAMVGMAQITLPFAFTEGKNEIGSTSGMSEKGLGGDYKRPKDISTKLKFDTTGDWVTLSLPALTQPLLLTYDIKGNPPSVDNCDGVFDVEVKTTGEYTSIKKYANISKKLKSGEQVWIPKSATSIRFIYTKKTIGNIGLGNIHINSFHLTIGESGYTTFYFGYPYKMPTGLTGNTVNVSGMNVMLTPSYSSGSSVPANTPLLISGTQGNHDATILSGTIAPVSATNLLKGTLTEQAITAPSGGKVYVFAKDDTDGLGFYWQNGTDGTTLTNAAGKCYLEVSGGSGVQGFRLDGTLTAIEAAATEKADEQIYDLSGRRVSNAGRGLYIVNGKKVIR